MSFWTGKIVGIEPVFRVVTGKYIEDQYMSKPKKYNPPVVNNLVERMATEVAEPKNAEMEINRVNRPLQMLSDTNQALKEQFSTLRSIIDSTNTLIFSVDRQYHYTSFNKRHATVMKAIYDGEIKINHSQLDYIDRKSVV